MNVYDSANVLAKELRETREFQLLKECKTKLAAEPDTENLVKEFMKQGQEIEIARYQGKEVPAATQEKLEKLQSTLQLNPLAVEYLNAFYRFNMMFQDISKTITNVVKEVLD